MASIIFVGKIFYKEVINTYFALSEAEMTFPIMIHIGLASIWTFH